MSFNKVYINQTSAFLPNDPIPNEEMESYLGLINNNPSKSRAIVLRNNGIKLRYYALDKNSKPTHTNAQMTALAIKSLFENSKMKVGDVGLLSCGTSSPDQMMPSHGVMVHGWVPEMGSVEVVSPSGVCCAGMHAFKYAYLAVKTGEIPSAVATGSERFSGSLVSQMFEDEAQKLAQLKEDPYISFDKEFLRWMLSDGASAFLLSDKPNDEGISLRVEWIEGVSYADELEACMYMGCEKQPDGSLKSYMDFSQDELLAKSIFSIKQDVKLLGKNIVIQGGIKLKEVLAKHGVNSKEVDFFLPHMSSEFFRMKIYDQLELNGNGIPHDRWFVNLSRVGNVGAASVYLMVNELFHSGLLKKGHKILLLVPESSRFSYMYSLLTVV
jgi:3-oxoacyl-[acyl-carrier-protein] synthase-3